MVCWIQQEVVYIQKIIDEVNVVAEQCSFS